MKVHPAPRKRNMTFQCSAPGAFGSSAGIQAPSSASRQKKLRRLPHIFSKVLELPLSADADVDVREEDGGFLFTVAVDVEDGAAPATVRARAVDIYPGVIKVVIRDGAEEEEDGGAGGGRRNSSLLLVDDLELDRWRFRLPHGTRPELASASYVGGDLVVSIPKGGGSDSEGGEEDGEDDEGEDGVTGAGIGRLVVVQ